MQRRHVSRNAMRRCVSIGRHGLASVPEVSKPETIRLQLLQYAGIREVRWHLWFRECEPRRNQRSRWTAKGIKGGCDIKKNAAPACGRGPIDLECFLEHIQVCG